MDAMTLVEQARKRLIAGNLATGGAPEFGALSANLTMQPSRAHWLMATDGTHLFYHPENCLTRDPAELTFTWAHETLHCALRHMFRKPDWCDWHEWNVSTDYAINGIIVPLAPQYGWKVPAGILYDAKYDGMSAEQIAHARRKEREAQAQAQQQQDEQGEPDGEPEPNDTQEQDDDDGEAEQDAGEPGGTNDEEGEDEGDAAGDADEPQDDGAAEDAEDADDADGEPDDSDAGEEGEGAGDSDEPGDEQGADAAGDDAEGAQADDADGSADEAGPGEGSAQDVEGDGTLTEHDDLRPAPEPSQDGDGEGEGGTGAASEPEVLDDTFWQEAVEQAAAVSRKAGTQPGAWARAITQTRTETVDWRAYTRQFIESVAPTRQSWARPSRRHVAQGLYLPSAKRENLPPIVLGVDTSGSITDANLYTFGEHANVIWHECKPRAMYVVYCDTRVTHVDVFVQGQDEDVTLVPHGGGGTAFQPVFDFVAEQVDAGEWEAPCALIYLTDLDGDQPVEPDYPVLWATVPGTYSTAPWGDTVPLG